MPDKEKILQVKEPNIAICRVLRKLIGALCLIILSWCFLKKQMKVCDAEPKIDA